MIHADQLPPLPESLHSDPQYQWPESEFYVSEEHRLVYCPIQKVACSSLKLWWAEITDGTANCFVSETRHGQRIDHGGLNSRFKLHTQSRRLGRRPLTEDGWFRIAFVRNPWSRLVSVFANKFVQVHDMVQPVFQAVHGPWKRRPVQMAGKCLLQALIPFMNSARRQPRMTLLPLLRGVKAWHDEFTFRHFIDFLAGAGLESGETDLHWRPQHRFLGDTQFHYIGRFERLEEDMQSISNLLGVAVKVPVANATTYSKSEASSTNCFADTPISELRKLPATPNYRQFYTRELEQEVASLYRRDVEQFGYEFEG
jgi:hypothetical protein